MPDYRATIDWLYGLQFFGMKLGLGNTFDLCRFLGNPQKRYPIVHIAGTNGKGSTSALIASVLQEAGMRVGLYTSPHLVRFTERVRVNGTEIGEEAIVEYAGGMRGRVDELRATFFEATTAMAFRAFADAQVDVAVIETGLGGRLDATNVVDPLLTVITSIGFDHMEHLGNTLPEIAREKAGIIKPHVPLICGVREREAMDVINDTARNERAPMRYGYEVAAVAIGGMDYDAMHVDVRAERHTLAGVASPFVGVHQSDNIANAVAAVEALEEAFGQTIDGDTLRRGIERGARNAGLRCRFETLRRAPRVVCDVAHNAPAFERLMATLDAISDRSYIWLMGMMADKDYRGALSAIAPRCAKVICVAPDLPRALPSTDLARAAREAGLTAVDGGTTANGYALALDAAGTDGIVMIAGSHFLAGEVLEAM